MHHTELRDWPMIVVGWLIFVVTRALSLAAILRSILHRKRPSQEVRHEVHGRGHAARESLLR